jgi:hypothetical protein
MKTKNFIFFLNTFIYLVCLINLSAQDTSVFVSAHPDDWQLFMNPNAYNSVKDSGKTIVFIHTTAGDAGFSTNNNYYLAREEGSLRAIRFLYNANNSFDNLGSNMNGTVVAINGHPILKFTYGNIISYFLRLPDGNFSGIGYNSNNAESLEKLYNGSLTSITAIDNSTTYNSLSDLKATLQSIIQFHSSASDKIDFNIADTDSSINPDDHSDHIHTSFIMQDVANTLGGIDLNLYTEYHSAYSPENLTSKDLLISAGTWGVTTSGISDNSFDGTWDTAHNVWVDKQYFRTITSDVNPPSSTSYRINAGGITVSASDGGSNWISNDIDGAYTGSTYSVTAGNSDSANLLNSNRHASIPNYIDATTFNSIFKDERWDPATNPEMEFRIPMENGQYTVNLFMGNSFNGTSLAGQRVFDIEIEGKVVRHNLDLIVEFGHQSGGMLSFPVTVSDGVLNIEFGHEVESPLVNAIEVLSDAQTPSQFQIDAIANQSSNPGATIDLVANAYGGDNSQSIIYSITGAPLGVVIDSSNGEISGIIDSNAGNGGSNNEGIHQVTVIASKTGSNDVQTQFTWTIVDSPITIYRINAGGVAASSKDGGPDWVSNDINGAYSGVGYSVTAGNSDPGNLLSRNRHSSIPSYIDTATFNSIFKDERWDPETGPDMTFDIPIADGQYVVNLYLGNSYSGTSLVGQRVFDIVLEGILVRSNLDLIDEFGHQSGGMLSFPVNISDGELNIEFPHKVENPLVNAIEVLSDLQVVQLSAKLGNKIETGINEKENNIEISYKEILMFPNPTSGLIQIDLSDYIGLSLDINIYNSLQQNVLTKHFDKNHSSVEEIDIRNLSDGLYQFVFDGLYGKEVKSIILSK